MGWWDNILYYPEGQLTVNSPLAHRINALSEQNIWAAMEVFNGTLGQHSFCVCHSSRPASTYKPNFESQELLGYIPVRNCRIVLDDGRIMHVKREPYPVFDFQPAVAALFRQIDGIKTVAECFDAATLILPNNYDKHKACREVFQYLWRLSHIFLRML